MAEGALNLAIGLILHLMRKARWSFLGLYLFASAGFLLVDPKAVSTWIVILFGAALCALLWTLTGFWLAVFGGQTKDRGSHG